MSGDSDKIRFCGMDNLPVIKHVALDFAKWVDDKGYTQTSNKLWANLSSENISDKDLYQLYLNSKQ